LTNLKKKNSIKRKTGGENVIVANSRNLSIKTIIIVSNKVIKACRAKKTNNYYQNVDKK
jgi:hypothetical protein